MSSTYTLYPPGPDNPATHQDQLEQLRNLPAQNPQYLDPFFPPQRGSNSASPIESVSDLDIYDRCSEFSGSENPFYGINFGSLEGASPSFLRGELTLFNGTSLSANDSAVQASVSPRLLSPVSEPSPAVQREFLATSWWDQPGRDSEEVWPSAVEWPTRGPLGGDDQRTRNSAATTSVAQVNARHCVAELAHEIVNKLGLDVDAKELVKSQHAFPELIKAFSIKLGLESTSETDQDVMYFVYKHHQ